MVWRGMAWHGEGWRGMASAGEAWHAMVRFVIICLGLPPGLGLVTAPHSATLGTMQAKHCDWAKIHPFHFYFLNQLELVF